MIHMARVKKCYGVDIGGLRPPVALRRATATSVDAAQKGLSHDHLHAARLRPPSPQARSPGKVHTRADAVSSAGRHRGLRGLAYKRETGITIARSALLPVDIPLRGASVGALASVAGRVHPARTRNAVLVSATPPPHARRRLYRIAILPVQRPGRRGPARPAGRPSGARQRYLVPIPMGMLEMFPTYPMGRQSLAARHVGSRKLPTCSNIEGSQHEPETVSRKRRIAAFELLAERAEHGQAPRGDALVRCPADKVPR